MRRGVRQRLGVLGPYAVEGQGEVAAPQLRLCVRQRGRGLVDAGEHVITAADPLPDGICQILEAIKTRAAAH